LTRIECWFDRPHESGTYFRFTEPGKTCSPDSRRFANSTAAALGF
jgi:hypothetical protein